MGLKKIKELFKKPDEAIKEQEEEKKENLSIQFELSSEKQTEIAELICNLVEDYSDSRADHMALRAECINQYEGIRAPKSEPWPGCSNISTMVTTVACDLLHAKLFSMAWNEKSLTWEGVEEHDVKIADINKRVMAWVTSTDMAMQDFADDMLQKLIVDGTIAVKKVWKPYWIHVTRKVPKEITPEAIFKEKLEYEVQYDYIRRERCFLELRPLENVYFPYDADSTERNWEDKFNIIDERWYTLADLKEMQLDGVIDDKVNLDDLKAEMSNLEEIKASQKARMEAEGSSAVVTVPENFKLKCYEAELMYDINEDGRRERCIFFIVAGSEQSELKMYLGGKPMHAVSRVGRSSWLIRPFLRRPGRAYGKGVPELVRHPQDEMDAIHNQRIDAGNMLIAPFFFYRAPSGMNPRRIIVGPATGVPLDDPDRDVRFPSFPNSGISVSFQEEKLVMEMIERLTYLTPAMLGKETSSRPTARGTLAVIQQGEQKFGLLGARVQYIYCVLLTDIRQKYEENMPPESWARVMGRMSAREYPSPEAMVGMYEAKMQLDLIANDPSNDRQMSMQLFQTMAMDPLVAQNPAFMWEVRADYLRALGREPVEKYIGPKPQTETGTEDVEDMIAYIEQEMSDIDLNDFDPATILPQLMEFRQSGRYEGMTPEAKAILQTVIRDLKMLYLKKMEAGMQNAAQGGNAQGTGSNQGGGQGGSMAGLMPQNPGAMGAPSTGGPVEVPPGNGASA